MTMVKRYVGYAESADRPAQVSVREGGGRRHQLAHHVMHSPKGFSWGFGGSGATELARCVLLDAFGVVSCPDHPKSCQCKSKWVDSTYPAFKSDIILKLDHDQDWHLEQANILDWVFDYEATDEPTPTPTPVPA